MPFLLKVAQLCLFHLGLPVRGKKTILSASSTQSVMVSQGKAGGPRGLGESGETGQGGGQEG